MNHGGLPRCRGLTAGIQRGTTDLDPIDAGKGLQPRSIAADAFQRQTRLAVGAGSAGPDRGAGCRGRLLRPTPVVVIPSLRQQAEPDQQPTKRASGTRRPVDEATAGKTRREGMSHDLETIAFGDDPLDVVAAGAELNEGHGHDAISESGQKWPTELPGSDRRAEGSGGHHRSACLFGTWSGRPPDFVRFMLPRSEAESAVEALRR